jgi:hypothetical protein
VESIVGKRQNETIDAVTRQAAKQATGARRIGRGSVSEHVHQHHRALYAPNARAIRVAALM